MACVEIDIENIKRNTCVANEIAGFVPYFLIAKTADIVTFPTIGATTNGLTASEKRLTTTGNFIFKAGKTWNRIEVADPQKIDLMTEEKGNSWESVMKAKIQNTLHTRGWCDVMKGEQFVVLAYETEQTLPILLGTDKFPAKFGKDKTKIMYGGEYNAEKAIDIEFEYTPKMPLSYAGVVLELAASSGTVSDGGTQRISFAGLIASINNFLTVYDSTGTVVYLNTSTTATKTSDTLTAGTFTVSIQQAGKAAIFSTVVLA